MISEDYEEPMDPGLRKLYSHMTDDQVREAQRNLRQYVAVIVKIYDRLKAEGKELARLRSRQDQAYQRPFS